MSYGQLESMCDKEETENISIPCRIRYFLNSADLFWDCEAHESTTEKEPQLWEYSGLPFLLFLTMATPFGPFLTNATQEVGSIVPMVCMKIPWAFFFCFAYVDAPYYQFACYGLL